MTRGKRSLIKSIRAFKLSHGKDKRIYERGRGDAAFRAKLDG